MNWFDYLLLGITAVYLVGGFVQGLIKQLFSLFGFLIILALAFAGSRVFSVYVAAYLDPGWLMPYQEAIARLGAEIPVERILNLVAGVLTFLVLFLILQVIFRLIGRGFKSINRIPVLGFFNRIGGAVIGLLIGLFSAYVLISIVSLVPLQFCVDAAGSSLIIPLVEQYLPPVTAGLKEIMLNFYLHTVNNGA